MFDPADDLSSGAYRFNYDSVAAEYAAKVDSAPFNALYERPAMMRLLPDLSGRRILDAGCGSGWYAEKLIESGAILDAVDSSAAMLDYARERLDRAGKTELGARLQVADLADPLPFDDDAFDGIVSPLVLHYLREWRPTLREMHRVLRPNGWLLFSTHHPAADAALFKTRNYFAVEHVVDHWDWLGRVEFYRRSLTEIVDSVMESDFVIDKLAEPLPTEELRAASPDVWETLMNQPAFLMILARKQ